MLIVPTVTSLQLTAGESREATEKHGGLVGGWLEDGMIRTIGLPPAAIKFSVQTLFH